MRIAAVLAMILFAGATSADAPQGDLSRVKLTRHFGDLPTCAHLGQDREICTWSNTVANWEDGMENKALHRRELTNEHFTCLLSKTASDMSQSRCVYEKVDDDVEAYFFVKPSYTQRTKGKRKTELWMNNHKAAVESTRAGHILDITRALGHGPVACLVAEVIACKWITNNRSPGHHTIARYLAASSMYASQDNDPVRLICEFDIETLERTGAPCVVTYTR